VRTRGLPLKALGSQPWFSTHFKPAIQVLIQCLLQGIQIPVAISFTPHLVQMRLCIPEPAVNGLVQVLPLCRIVRPGFHSSVAHLYLQRVLGEWRPAPLVAARTHTQLNGGRRRHTHLALTTLRRRTERPRRRRQQEGTTGPPERNNHPPAGRRRSSFVRSSDE